MGAVDREAHMRCFRSGACGEKYCLDRLGIREDDDYEIKAAARRNGQIIVKAIQLLHSLKKFYIIVIHDRKGHNRIRGPNKGKWKYDETVEKGFQNNPVKILIVRARNVLKAICEHKRPLLMTNYENDGAWAPYWAVRLSSLFAPDVLVESDDLTIMGEDNHPPPFMREDEHDDKVPF